MNTYLGFLKKMNWFGFLKNRLLDQKGYFKQWADLNEIETAICLEKALNKCYSTLEERVHDLAFRYECRHFEKQTEHHQGALNRVFSPSQESETAVADKLYKYQLQLSSPKLLIRDVINLAVNLTARKIDVYRYLSLKDHEHRNLFNQFIEDSEEENSFLGKKWNFQLNSLEDAQYKVALN